MNLKQAYYQIQIIYTIYHIGNHPQVKREDIINYNKLNKQ